MSEYCMFVSCFFKHSRVGMLVESVCMVCVMRCTCVCLLTVNNCWESVMCLSFFSCCGGMV